MLNMGLVRCSVLERMPSLQMHKTKTALAVEALRDAILHGEIKPGERLHVDDLSRQLKMSRTPIREAVRILEAEGLIVNEPHRQVTVADLSGEKAQEVYLLRAHLEGLAAQWATDRMTADDIAELEKFLQEMEQAYANRDYEAFRRSNAGWHHCFHRVAGAKLLRDFILRLWVRFPWDVIWEVPGRVETSLQEHRQILEAVKARDAEKVGQLMREHILSGMSTAKSHRETTPRVKQMSQ